MWEIEYDCAECLSANFSLTISYVHYLLISQLPMQSRISGTKLHGCRWLLSSTWMSEWSYLPWWRWKLHLCLHCRVSRAQLYWYQWLLPNKHVQQWWDMCGWRWELHMHMSTRFWRRFLQHWWIWNFVLWVKFHSHLTTLLLQANQSSSYIRNNSKRKEGFTGHQKLKNDIMLWQGTNILYPLI